MSCLKKPTSFMALNDALARAPRQFHASPCTLIESASPWVPAAIPPSRRWLTISSPLYFVILAWAASSTFTWSPTTVTSNTTVLTPIRAMMSGMTVRVGKGNLVSLLTSHHRRVRPSQTKSTILSWRVIRAPCVRRHFCWLWFKVAEVPQALHCLSLSGLPPC